MRYLVDENEDLATMPSTDTVFLRMATELSTSQDDDGAMEGMYDIDDNNSLESLDRQTEEDWNVQHHTQTTTMMLYRNEPIQTLVHKCDVERLQQDIVCMAVVAADHDAENIESVETCERTDIPKFIIINRSTCVSDEESLDDCESFAKNEKCIFHEKCRKRRLLEKSEQGKSAIWTQFTLSK
jgi:hypothetical protein